MFVMTQGVDVAPVQPEVPLQVPASLPAVCVMVTVAPFGMVN
jgi:hypothetical protein